jgi:hypothetical protein
MNIEVGEFDGKTGEVGHDEIAQADKPLYKELNTSANVSLEKKPQDVQENKKESEPEDKEHGETDEQSKAQENDGVNPESVLDKAVVETPLSFHPFDEFDSDDSFKEEKTVEQLRLDQTPINPEKYSWDGERGNSLCRFKDSGMQEKLKEKGLEGIEYKNSQIDLSPFAEEQVEIRNMTSDRPKNFKQAYEQLAEQYNAEGRGGRTDWTRREVEADCDERSLIPHECSDMKTIQFVDKYVHEHAPHSGGVFECKQVEKSSGGAR